MAGLPTMVSRFTIVGQVGTEHYLSEVCALVSNHSDGNTWREASQTTQELASA